MKLMHTIRWALAGALVLGFAPVAPAQEAPKQTQEFEFQIDPLDIELVLDLEEDEDQPKAAKAPVKRVVERARVVPGTWLGVLSDAAGDDLRAQLELESRGLVVREVRPESPAFRAGIKVHDVLLEAGGKTLSQIDDLQAAVGAAGEKQIEIVLLRGGKKLKLSATPAKRPDNLDVEQNVEVAPGAVIEAEASMEKVLQALQNQVGREGKAAWQFRAFGPGVVTAPLQGSKDHVFWVDATAGKVDLPKGVSVTITKEGSEPAKITVKREGKSWDVTAGKLDSIPEDLRPHVVRMLSNPQANGTVTWRLDEHLPSETRDRIIKAMPGNASPFTLPLPPGGAGGIVGGMGGLKVAPPTVVKVSPYAGATSGFTAGSKADQDPSGVKAELAKIREELSQLRKEVHGRNADRDAIETLLKRLLEESKK